LIFGEEPLIEGGVDPMALLYWSFAQLAFLGEWLSRAPLEQVLAGNGQRGGLSAAEIGPCFDHVLDVVEQVSAGPGGGG
jgi:hypothetical protein